MTEQPTDVLIPLRVGDEGVMYVAATPLSDANDGFGEVEVAGRAQSTRQVVEVLGLLAEEFISVLSHSGATKFAVELGCEVAVESGQVFAVLGKASSKSSLKVTLEWQRPLT